MSTNERMDTQAEEQESRREQRYQSRCEYMFKLEVAHPGYLATLGLTLALTLTSTLTLPLNFKPQDTRQKPL